MAAAKELAQLDPDHPDPGGMVSDARANLRDAELADRYAQGVNYLNHAFWDKAVAVFTGIEQEHPGFRDTASLLLMAQQRHDLAAWYHQAEVAIRHQDWATATSALEKTCAIHPTYRGAGARLEQARSAQRLRTLVDEVTAVHQTGRWKDVLAAGDGLAELDPDHPDPGGIVSDAQAKLREAELAERYAQGVDHIRQQHWQQAVEVFDTIEQQQPGYRDTPALRRTAQQNLPVDQEAEANQQATPPPQDPPVVTRVKAKDHGRGEAPPLLVADFSDKIDHGMAQTHKATADYSQVPLYRQRNIVLAVVAAAAVVAVAVVIIVAKTTPTWVTAQQRLLAMVPSADKCTPAQAGSPR